MFRFGKTEFAFGSFIVWLAHVLTTLTCSFKVPQRCKFTLTTSVLTTPSAPSEVPCSLKVPQWCEFTLTTSILTTPSELTTLLSSSLSPVQLSERYPLLFCLSHSYCTCSVTILLALCPLTWSVIVSLASSMFLKGFTHSLLLCWYLRHLVVPLSPLGVIKWACKPIHTHTKSRGW